MRTLRTIRDRGESYLSETDLLAWLENYEAKLLRFAIDNPGSNYKTQADVINKVIRGIRASH